jgi:sigma-B regulation protein RsbU (phosphoserine phosphatase)
MVLPAPTQWARATGLRRWAAIGLSFFLFLVLLLGAQQTIRAPYDGLVEKEWLVARVSPDSPADDAGFVPGDRLLGYSPSDLPPAPGRTRTYTIERDGETLELALTFVELPANEKARRLSQTVVSLLFLSIGLVVFLQRSDKTGTLFFLICFLFAGVFATRPPIAGSRFFLPTKMFYNVCVLLLPAVFLHFFLIFPKPKSWLDRHPRPEVVLYTPVVLMLAASLLLDLVIIRRGAISQSALLFQDIGSLVLTAYYLLGLLSFGHSFRVQQSIAMKRRLRYVLAGTILGAGPIVVLSLILSIWPSVTIPGFRYSFLTLLLIPFSFGHAIAKYRLMDLDIIVRRSVAYTLLTAALVAIYVGVVQGLGGYLLHLTGRLTLFFSVLSIFIIALVFSTLRDRIQTLVDRVFYMGRYSFPDTLSDFRQLLASPVNLAQMMENLAVRLAEVLKVENVSVLICEPVSEGFVIRAESGLPCLSVGNVVLRPHYETVQWLQEEQIALPLERLTGNLRYQNLPAEERTILLDQLNSAILAPVISEQQLIAILSVGRRKSHEPPSRQDLALVDAIASQTGRVIEAARLRDETEAREKMQHELEIARQIQTRLLPKDPPRIAGLTVTGINIPCQEVGGDFYDYIALDDHRLGLAIADVCGKGVSAALLMATLQAAFRAEAETQRPPAAVLNRANQRLLTSFGPERFASLFYGIVDVRTMRLLYASAGHDPPYLVRASGQIEPLDSTGMLLGVTDDAVYIDREIPLNAGDTLVLYTDGITEELNEDHETFGQSGLQSVLSSTQGQTPQEIADHILDAVHHFTMGSIQDDVTLVTLGVESSPQPAAPRTLTEDTQA